MFTDRHAALIHAEFFSDLRHLRMIDWTALQQRDFRIDPHDPEKTDRYQAEALVYKHLPVSAFLGIACHSDNTRDSLKTEMDRIGIATKIAIRPDWYFQ